MTENNSTLTQLILDQLEGQRAIELELRRYAFRITVTAFAVLILSITWFTIYRTERGALRGKLSEVKGRNNTAVELLAAVQSKVSHAEYVPERGAFAISESDYHWILERLNYATGLLRSADSASLIADTLGLGSDAKSDIVHHHNQHLSGDWIMTGAAEDQPSYYSIAEAVGGKLLGLCKYDQDESFTASYDGDSVRGRIRYYKNKSRQLSEGFDSFVVAIHSASLLGYVLEEGHPISIEFEPEPELKK